MPLLKKRKISGMCSNSLRGAKSFLKSQIMLLSPFKADKEARAAIEKLEACLRVLKDTKNESNYHCKNHLDFPFKIGLVAQASMVELFRTKQITDEDIEFLLSKEAQKLFVCRKLSFIRPYVSGELKERADSFGRNRYYYPGPILERNGKKFYLTKELTKDKLPNLLEWIYSHGISKNTLIALCEKYSQGKMHVQREGVEQISEKKSLPKKAEKLGGYVKSFFEWIVTSRVILPDQVVKNGLDINWSAKQLHLWRPLFATEDSLTKSDRDGHRYWSKPFNFAGHRLYVNSQWYGKKFNGKQKFSFDEFAVDLAKTCGMEFKPYPLRGIERSKEQIPRVEGKEASKSIGRVFIKVSSENKKTVRFKL